MTLIARYLPDYSPQGMPMLWGPAPAPLDWTDVRVGSPGVRECAGPGDRAALRFDGLQGGQDADPDPRFSIPTTGQLSVAVWFRPDALTFPVKEGSGHVQLVAKGATTGEYEWALRLYSADNTEGRGNRVSFYCFNPQGGKGAGAYWQPSRLGPFLEPGAHGEGFEEHGWHHVAATVDAATGVIRIWVDGVPGRDGALSDYNIHPVTTQGRLYAGCRGTASRFQGALSDLCIFDHCLTEDEIHALREPLPW